MQLWNNSVVKSTQIVFFYETVSVILCKNMCDYLVTIISHHDLYLPFSNVNRTLDQAIEEYL